jgi:predicted peroxiredoxin
MGAKKIGLVVTHSADSPELATIPFVLANGAMAMGVDPIIVLQGEGVRLALPGGAEAVTAKGFPALADLMAAVLGAGHKIMACSPCLGLRGIAEDELLDGVYVGGAGIVVQAMLDCENFLSY